MKKLVVSLLLAGVIVAAFGFVSTANAQGPVDQPFYGQGGGRGGHHIWSLIALSRWRRLNPKGPYGCLTPRRL